MMTIFIWWLVQINMHYHVTLLRSQRITGMEKKILISHPDPWGIGVSCTMVYHPMFDGSIEHLMALGYTATYEDGTICTHYDGETLKTLAEIMAAAPTTSFKYTIMDFSL